MLTVREKLRDADVRWRHDRQLCGSIVVPLHGCSWTFPEPGRKPAVDIYSRLLSLAPQNGALNYEYGSFLASTTQIARAIPYLEKAKSSGVVEADYTLALVYAAAGNRKMALQSIDSYLKRVPTDANAAAIRDAIRTGNLTVKRTAP